MAAINEDPKQRSIDEFKSDADYPNVLIYKGTRFPFNPHKIVYTKPKPTAHGGYVINTSYPLEGTLVDGTQVLASVDIVLQTPTMSTTFGFSTKEHEGGKIRGTIDLTFYDDAGADIQAFKAVMGLWDELLLTRAKESKAIWFRSNKITDDILAYLYNPMIRENVRKSDGKRFSDSFRSKVPRRFDRFDVEVYNDRQQPISLDELTRQCQVRMLVRQTGIWFSDTMFVSSFEAPQLQKMGEGRLTGYGFVDEADAGNNPGGYAMADDV